MNNKSFSVNLIHCDVKRVCYYYYYSLLLFGPLDHFTDRLCFYLWMTSLYNLLNICFEMIAVETLVLAVSRSSLSQSHLRRKFYGRKGGKKSSCGIRIMAAWIKH